MSQAVTKEHCRRAPLVLSLFLLIWPMAGYPALLELLTRWRRATVRPGVGTALPPLTVIVATHNEAADIGSRIINLLESDYPPELVSIIVVDSGSSDGTADIARSFADQCDITVVQEQDRSGKASAVNLGVAAARTDLVVLTDAPTRFAPDALKIVAQCMADPAVGAATGYFQVHSSQGAMGDEEARFWRFRNRLRSMEAQLDSTPFLTGELCCFRRDLVPPLKADSVADDMEIALAVRRRGYRVVIDNHAMFTEARTGAPQELLRRKSHRAAGGVQQLARGSDMLLRPSYSWFGLVILPSAWSYYLPLRLPAFCVAAYSLRGRRALPVLGAAGLVIGAATLAAPKQRKVALAQLRMLAFNEAVLWAAWVRVFTGSMDVKWFQERSTRGAMSKSVPLTKEPAAVGAAS